MYPKFDLEIAGAAAKHLASSDAVLAPIIEAAGLPAIQPHDDYYWELVDSIISQQLSVKAAATIERRFVDLFGGSPPKPEQILTKSIDELRTAGLSQAKAIYIQDLAGHVVSGKVAFDKLDSQSNQEIINELTDVKGIGEWTAHMFLIFAMGRTDVLPTGDLGIKNGIQKLYGLSNQPGPEEIRAIANKNSWHPYDSIACWYIWHSLDNAPK